MALADRCVMPEAMRALAAPRFGALGAPFMQPVAARPLPDPQLFYLNTGLAQDLGLDLVWSDSPAALPLLAGNAPWPGQTAFASAYAGHQFGAWVPRLGDGRVLTLAEWQTPDGGPVEVQLKGAGPTPYARGSDGRATLRSSVRELLACEALHALGVPTTRALSLVGSSLAVMREEQEAAAVLSRTAPCFVRFGHFEFHARHGSPQQLAALADHVIEHHFPYLVQQPQRHAAWLAEVIELTAALFAQWQTLGFCHGVLNTDNLSVLGLTLDYGPYGVSWNVFGRTMCATRPTMRDVMPTPHSRPSGAGTARACWRPVWACSTSSPKWPANRLRRCCCTTTRCTEVR